MSQNLIMFTSSDNKTSLSVQLDANAETVWLSLNQLSDLFERDKSVISRHLKKIFKEEELDRKSAVAFFATTASDEKTYNVEYFNLDAILSVGYRVNSKRGTEFRRYCTYLHIRFNYRTLPNESLVALALLVAQSNPTDKDIIIKLIINLISQD